MSQYHLTGPAPSRPVRRPATWMLLAWPALGGATVAVSAVIALGFTTFAASGADGGMSGDPAYDYVQTHFPSSPLGLLTGYPLALAAGCPVIAAATALATFRKWAPAAILVIPAAAIPWFQAMSLAAGAPATLPFATPATAQHPRRSSIRNALYRAG